MQYPQLSVQTRFITRCSNVCPRRLCKRFLGLSTTSGILVIFPTAGVRLLSFIPVPKPGKDKSDPSNYRPIALTSCICKIMERMINNRLVWYLERNNLLLLFRAVFANNAAQPIISFDWSHSFGKLLCNDSMPLLYSLIWKRHMKERGNMA